MSDLKEELLDLYSKNPDPEGWIKEECAGVFTDSYHKILAIDPEDAKSINEVKSFTVEYELSGIGETAFKRK
jgi:hypothetical protein